MTDIKWEFISHWSSQKSCCRSEKATVNGVTIYKDSVTRKNGENFGASKTTYEVNKKTYKTLEEAIKSV